MKIVLRLSLWRDFLRRLRRVRVCLGGVSLVTHYDSTMVNCHFFVSRSRRRKMTNVVGADLKLMYYRVLNSTLGHMEKKGLTITPKHGAQVNPLFCSSPNIII